MTDFPLDWGDWRAQWNDWRAAHAGRMGERIPKAFPGQNLLADEILGTWRIAGRVVELSEVTFPDLRRDPVTGRLPYSNRRGIGLTFGTGTDPEASSGKVVWSFDELEDALGIGGAS